MQTPSVNKKTSRVIIILGMHRSGTSALTGSLEQAGVELGKVKQYSIDNKKGSRESPKVMVLHEDIFRRNKGSWRNPDVEIEWSPIHEQLQESIIECHEHDSLWGFKDPRTLFFLDNWLKLLPQAELIGIFRHPFLVAESLRKRNNFQYSEAIKLWCTYNSKLLDVYSKSQGFPLIEFCLDPEGFNINLMKLLNQLDLEPKAVTFFDNNLRQQQIPDLHTAHNSDKALEIYEELQQLVKSNPN